jgi:endonuclease G
MFAAEQVKETERRFGERRPQRQIQIERVKTGAIASANEPKRVAQRKRRLARAPSTPAPLATEVGASAAAPETSDIALERIIGPADLINVNYLRLALRASRSVGRIRLLTNAGLTRGHATGFLLSPRVLLTNHHVFPAPDAAAPSEVDFDYETGVDGVLRPWRTARFEPSILFITDAELDYTLVALAPQSVPDLGDYGWLPLIEEQGKILIGEFLNIIQHPSGAPKQLALRRNQLVDILPSFVHYETDTLPGSSGSPVFNDQWEVIALHHSGVPRRDGQGRVLARDGSLWSEPMGDQQIDWIANEGVRVSRIVAHLRSQALVGLAREMRDEVLSPPALPVIEEGGRSLAGGSSSSAGSVWRLPVVLTIEPVSRGQAGGATVQPASTAGATVLPPSLQEEQARALAELAGASERDYYDEAVDKAQLAEYYRGVQIGADSGDNFRLLNRVLTETHLHPVPYKPTLHLYPWVDLQPDHQLQSVYSNRRFDPRRLIEEEFAIEAAEIAWAEALRASGASEATVAAALMEAVSPYNCEHVVPQSWFAKRDPMRGDLHHLFTCEWGCNSFRGNIPYFDFADFREADRSECGRRLDDRFEPEAGKGAVARATLYFLLRYPGEFEPGAEPKADRLPILLQWHEDHPVSVYERHRNVAILERQGNRNPLIDDPAWAAHIDFSLGFLT